MPNTRAAYTIMGEHTGSPLQYYHYLPCCLFGPLRRYIPKKREPQCNRSSLEKKWRWQCGTVALLATTGTLVPQRSALGYYSPTNGTKWSSLVPTAIGRTQHGRSSCPCGLRIDGTTRREGLTVLYNKKRTSF